VSLARKFFKMTRAEELMRIKREDFFPTPVKFGSKGESSDVNYNTACYFFLFYGTINSGPSIPSRDTPVPPTHCQSPLSK